MYIWLIYFLFQTIGSMKPEDIVMNAFKKLLEKLASSAHFTSTFSELINNQSEDIKKIFLNMDSDKLKINISNETDYADAVRVVSISTCQHSIWPKADKLIPELVWEKY